jgi:hypothetical protein
MGRMAGAGYMGAFILPTNPKHSYLPKWKCFVYTEQTLQWERLFLYPTVVGPCVGGWDSARRCAASIALAIDESNQSDGVKIRESFEASHRGLVSTANRAMGAVWSDDDRVNG